MSSLSRFDRLAYKGQHASFLLNSVAFQLATRVITRAPVRRVSMAVLQKLKARHDALHERDLANVEAGYYPRELLFSMPLRQYLRALPALLRDAPAVSKRRTAGDYKDLPPHDSSAYPPYYRRTFHWQTGGYLSEHSADVYELGVELLFRGTADVMRRQIIPPVSRWLAARPSDAAPAKLLDVACGTGAALRQLIGAHPDLDFAGIDLSPPYLAAARERLVGQAKQLTLQQGNAEHLPYADGSLDIITCVYLFHELPRNARRRVVREFARVLAPGGLLVIEDSAQLSESGEIEEALRGFAEEFHEPFYNDYLEDDLAAMLGECGFAGAKTSSELVAKVVVATKPS